MKFFINIYLDFVKGALFQLFLIFAQAPGTLGSPRTPLATSSQPAKQIEAFTNIFSFKKVKIVDSLYL